MSHPFKIIIFFLCLIAGMLLSSCENEVDLITDYQETTIIYGLLNPASTTHKIRVQKSFLGPGNALLMAQNPDSIYFDTSHISLFLEKTGTGSNFKSYPMYPEFSTAKSEGLFTDQGHYIFRVDSVRLDPDATYRIRFENKSSGDTITGTSKIIGRLITFLNPATSRINLANPNPFRVNFFSCKNGKMYGLILRIRYTETKRLTQVTTSKYLDYVLPGQTSRTLSGGDSLYFSLDGESIFRFLGQQIKRDSTVTRDPNSFKNDLLFTIATDDFFNYTQVNSPDNNLNYIPDFTNLSSGKGLFTSRLDTTIAGILFNNPTYISLQNSPLTRHIFQ